MKRKAETFRLLAATATLSPGAGSSSAQPWTRSTELTTLAQRIKALPTTVFLRIGYEFDLLGGQYGPAETYKLAYRHIVDLLRAQGADNAVYVWHSAGAFWRGDSSFLGQAKGEYGMPVPDADPQPPLRKLIEQGQLNCQPDRVMQRELKHRETDLDPAGLLSDRGREDDRVGEGRLAGEVVLGQPDPVEAQLLGEHGLSQALLDDPAVVGGV